MSDNLDPLDPRLAATARFFARVWYFDLACPKCGRVHQITRHTPVQIYNRRTGVFCCLWCRLELAIGLIAYRVEKPRGRRGITDRSPAARIRRRRESSRRYLLKLAQFGIPGLPDDWTPTITEALQLREYLQWGLFQQGHRKPGALRNVLAPGCRCDLGPPVRTDPACPVHAPGSGVLGAPALAGDGDTDQKK
ncbi:MAG TPA: hypothetical protein VFO16_14115 [Pseudonocardiaceae bacterium]|nr:hypothetical protein [Pseudonocardiaceae bacterium]